MKRSMCGLVVLAAATTLWSCNGDPTGDFQTGERIVADPGSVFVDHGASEFVVARMVDNQGNQLVVDFTPQNVGPGITVEKDTTFLQTTIGTTLETRQRFIVTGVTPTSTSFELVSGGQTVLIPVKVTPVGLASVTLSNAAPAMNEPLTVTLPAGFKFGTAPGVTVGSDVGVTTAVAPDSTSVTVVLPPGTTGAVTADSVQADFLPGVNLALPTDQTVTVGATPLVGTDDPSTAPIIPLPAPGGVAPTFDVPDFVSSGFFRFYRIDVAEPGDYTVTLDWDIGSDMDLYLCFDLACDEGDFAAAGASHPESAEYTIATPGTYWLWVNDYAGDAAGATISLVITR